MKKSLHRLAKAGILLTKTDPKNNYQGKMRKKLLTNLLFNVCSSSDEYLVVVLNVTSVFNGQVSLA